MHPTQSVEGELSQILSSVIETAIDGIITITAKGEILTINKSACNLFGYDENELLGAKVNLLMTHHDEQHHDSYINNYLTTRKPQIIGIGREVIGRRKNGETFPFRLAVSEVILNDRIIFTGILHDLTDIKQAQEDIINLNKVLEEKVEERTNQLEEAINRLLKTNQLLTQSESELKEALEKEKELNSLKSRFVQMASHEFRTPLSTILSSVSLINKYPLAEQQLQREKHINRIKSAVNNLTGILNDFLSLSRMEEGQINVNLTPVDFIQLCEEVHKELTVILKPGQTIIPIHTGLTKIHTDQHILKNILFNLLSNAIKYSGENTTITCKSNLTDEGLVLSVIDEGYGIPLEDQKHLFTRFFRATNVENIQGTGLGLNIVKRYLTLLNGKIDFESEHRKGSIFTITIPHISANE